MFVQTCTLLWCIFTGTVATSAYSPRGIGSYDVAAYQYLTSLTDVANGGLGSRVTNTKEEVVAAEYLYLQLTEMGYPVRKDEFTYKVFADPIVSTNLVLDIKGLRSETVLLVAHYDSTGEQFGSEGATDNGAGTAALLTVAKALWDMQPHDLPFSIRILWTGAEENGLHGSIAYVKQALLNGDLEDIRAVINLDTVGGGDFLYVHSAHSDYREYDHECKNLGLSEANYTYDPVVRDQLVSASAHTDSVENVFVVHPDYPGYPRGETGSWSDHAPFACAGLPVGYIETTNFNIEGQHYYDGYSQTIHPHMWDCFNETSVGACNRHTETKWGKIWHTEFDRLDVLESIFPGRVQEQLGDTVDSLVTFLVQGSFMQAVLASEWTPAPHTSGDIAEQATGVEDSDSSRNQGSGPSHTQILLLALMTIIVLILATLSLVVVSRKALHWHRSRQALYQHDLLSESDEDGEVEDETILMKDVVHDT